jgi:hypothetical protein
VEVDPMLAVGQKPKYVDTTKLFGPYLKLELGMRGFRVSVENFN